MWILIVLTVQVLTCISIQTNYPDVEPTGLFLYSLMIGAYQTCWLWLELGVMVFQQYFSYIVAISFIGGVNQSIR